MAAEGAALGAEPALSTLGLGCSRIGSFNNPQPLDESLALVLAAIDMGVTTIDTANIYGQGDSERTIGRALRGRRDEAFLVTKAGQGFSAKMRLLRWLKPALRPLVARRGAGVGTVTARREQALRTDWRAERLAASLNASLRRLGTTHIDGFLLHSPPAEAVRDPAVGEALAALKRAGKLRHFGVSCDDMGCLEAALSMPGLSLLQLPFDLIVAARENGLGGRIRERGIVVLAREVIRMQPGVGPATAVRNAVAEPLVASTLVGTTSRANLAALVAAVAPS